MLKIKKKSVMSKKRGSPPPIRPRAIGVPLPCTSLECFCAKGTKEEKRLRQEYDDWEQDMTCALETYPSIRFGQERLYDSICLCTSEQRHNNHHCPGFISLLHSNFFKLDIEICGFTLFGRLECFLLEFFRSRQVLYNRRRITLLLCIGHFFSSDLRRLIILRYVRSVEREENSLLFDFSERMTSGALKNLDQKERDNYLNALKKYILG